MSNPRIAEASLKAGTRFPVNRKDHTQKGKHISTLLNEIASKKFRYENPETQTISRIRGDKALVIAAFWQAIQGNGRILKEVWERMYGKVPDEFKGQITFNQMGEVFIDGKKLEVKIGND